ncbi:Sec-independent protein translocase subunit TatA [Geodermatophilus sp. SYSU D00710]
MNLGPLEIGLIILAVLLLFGYKKLPDASRSLGRSLRIFKGEMKGMKDDDTRTPAGAPAAAAVVPPAPAQLDAADRDRRAQLEAEAAAAEARAAELRARAARPGVADPR